MAKEMKPHPGGYNKERLTVGICYACETQPIAKGNLRLCHWCYTDEWDALSRPDRNKVTEEDACELILRVAIMEKEPPTPVKRFSCKEYTQVQLQTILDGG